MKQIGLFAGTSTTGWVEVPTHPGYAANTSGQVRGPRGRVLRPMKMTSGHLYVITPKPRSPRKLFIHRAVLLAFAGPPTDPALEGRHLDGNPSNNALSNLAWGTRLENARDRDRHGTERFGEDKPAARLTEDQIQPIRDDPRASRVVGKAYGISHTAVLRIRRGDRWRRAA